MNDDSVFITGGGGYIGSVLTHKLLNQSYRIIVFDNFRFTDIGIRDIKNHPSLKVINGDLRNINNFKKNLRNVSVIIHLAAISDGKSGRRNPELTKKVNFDSLKIFVKVAEELGVKRFIFASTFGVYGNHYKQPLTEDLIPIPVDPYSESKLLGEQFLRKYNSDSLITTSLRIAMVYGVSPRMRFNFIVNNMTIRALKEGKLTVLGGEQKRPQIHIDDITNYLIHFLKFKKEKIASKIFNAGGQNPSIIKIAEIIKKIIKLTKIEIIPGRKNESSFELNSEKIKNELGLKPSYTISDAVNQIRQYYIDGNWNNIKANIFYN